MTRYVTYFRVSTAKQGRSGLGLEAQKAAVTAFLKQDDRVVASFTEVESGKTAERPQLHAALRAARAHKAVLLIAKLDRLSRNVAFIATLLESDVTLVACDMPEADRSWLQMAAVWAEREARLISERTRAALAAAKARGVVLGGYRGHAMPDAVTRAGQATVVAYAQERASTLAPVIAELRAKGAQTAAAIADGLNDLGIPTPRSGRWHAASAARLLHRLDAAHMG